MNTHASPKAPLPLPTENRLDERSRRARTEPMSVLALGDGLYEVESGSESTYLVDTNAGRCTCPDYVFREARCKHVRRVAIEITDGRTPPPGEMAVECRDCETAVFVGEDRVDSGGEGRGGPVYCDAHGISPGDTVRDRETGDHLTVVDDSELRADYVRIPEASCTVAEYGSNADYDPDVPVVGAVYPHARVARNGPVPESIQVYVFPRTRLRKVTS